MAQIPKTHFFLICTILSLLYIQINTKCSMAQDPNGKPRPVNPDEVEPQYEQGIDTKCQDFVGMKTCCSPYQLQEIEKNFNALESIFGGDGGCDACVVNLKRFWCYFTCAPNQAEFIELGELTNYTIDGTVHELRDITYYISDDTNCDLFKSCKKTKFVAQVPSMGNAIGFTNFQGINAYTKTPAYVTMKVDNSRGLVFEVDRCGRNVSDTGYIRGYGCGPKEEGLPDNGNCTVCSCNSCDDRCDYNIDASVAYMNGANPGLIAGCYVFVLIATIALFFYKKHSNKDESRPSDIRYSDMVNN